MKKLLLLVLLGAVLAACETPGPAPEQPAPAAAEPPPTPYIRPQDAPPQTIAAAAPALAEPAPTPPPAAEPPPSTPAPLPPALSDEAIQKTFRLHERYFAKAYREHLPKHPGLNGTVMVDFTAAPDGSVQGARLAESTMKDSVFDATIVKLVGQMNFPPAQAATPVSHFPVRFQRAGKK